MPGYILNAKKTFEIFVRTENLLKEGVFPIMAEFESDEVGFWVKAAKKHAGKRDKIIEIGCGSGRILKALAEAGFSPCGCDNNPLFIDYCKKQDLDVFYLDATKEVPKPHKSKYKIAGIGFNTLFNFPEKVREKWISCAHALLEERGILIIIAYSDNEFVRARIDERVRFYKDCLNPPENYPVEFFDDGKERGIMLFDNNHKERFFSRWLSKEELLGEMRKWKGFDVLDIEPLECGIAWAVLLVKK